MTDQITIDRAVIDGALACLTEEAIGDVFYEETIAALRAMLAQAEPVQSNTVLQTFSDIDKGIYTNASFSHANVVMVSKDHYASLLDSAVMQQQAEPKCNPHPDAPHGFVRSASHNEGRYVCECEGWEPQAEPAQSEYGSTDCATFAGLPMTDGDKRLSAMLTQAFGTDHPAIHDLVALLFAARGKKQDESVQDEALSAALGWPGGISNPVLDRKSLLQQVAELRTSRSIKEKA